jgi:DNA-binding NarL/FixJ family response regulator
MAAQSRAVELVKATPRLPSASGKPRRYGKVEAPYLVARARALIGAACRALGDGTGRLEVDAARTCPNAWEPRRFTQADARPGEAHVLTARELQVLRLVAAGKTNKLIARQLGLSDRTVDRHVSNIFAKLHVSSRAAATAHAYQRKLI